MILENNKFCESGFDKEKLPESAACYGKFPYGEPLKAVAEGKVRC